MNLMRRGSHRCYSWRRTWNGASHARVRVSTKVTARHPACAATETSGKSCPAHVVVSSVFSKYLTAEKKRLNL